MERSVKARVSTVWFLFIMLARPPNSYLFPCSSVSRFLLFYRLSGLAARSHLVRFQARWLQMYFFFFLCHSLWFLLKRMVNKRNTQQQRIWCLERLHVERRQAWRTSFWKLKRTKWTFKLILPQGVFSAACCMLMGINTWALLAHYSLLSATASSRREKGALCTENSSGNNGEKPNE